MLLHSAKSATSAVQGQLAAGEVFQAEADGEALKLQEMTWVWIRSNQSGPLVDRQPKWLGAHNQTASFSNVLMVGQGNLFSRVVAVKVPPPVALGKEALNLALLMGSASLFKRTTPGSLLLNWFPHSWMVSSESFSRKQTVFC